MDIETRLDEVAMQKYKMPYDKLFPAWQLQIWAEVAQELVQEGENYGLY